MTNTKNNDMEYVEISALHVLKINIVSWNLIMLDISGMCLLEYYVKYKTLPKISFKNIY